MANDPKSKKALIYSAKVIECPTELDAQRVMDNLVKHIAEEGSPIKTTSTGKHVLLFPSHSWMVVAPDYLTKVLTAGALHSGLVAEETPEAKT